MSHNLRNGFLSLVLAASALPFAASAGTVVDTGTPVNPTSDWLVFRNSNPFEFQNLAVEFSLAQADTITGLEGFIGGEGGTFSISLATSSTNPDRPQAQFFLQQASVAASQTGVWAGLTGLNLNLGAGDYWLIFSSRPDLGDTMTYGYMPNNAPNAVGPEAYIHVPYTSDWERYDDLNIGVRITDSRSAAPEPAAWALMIGGLGLAGASLRRRSLAIRS